MRFLIAALIALLLAACGRQSRAPEGVEVLHPSTLRETVNAADQLSALFPDGQRALITQGIFEIQRLFLVDLAAGRVTPIPLPSKQTFDDFAVVPEGVLLFTRTGPQEPRVALVTPAGELRALELIEVWLGQIGNYAPIEGAATRMNELLAAGELEGLTEIREIAVEGGDARPVGFLNDRYYIAINFANERDLPTLRAHATESYTRDRATLAEPSYPGLRFEVTRSPFVDMAGSSDNRNITRVEIYRDEALVKRVELPLSSGFYHRAVVIGDRLYLIGEGVLYVELAPLAAGQ